MALTQTQTQTAPRTTTVSTTSDPVKQAYWLLRGAFVLAPIVFGLDKFFNWGVDWTAYLAPWIDRTVPGSAQSLLYVVGVIEIGAGILVAVRPRIGGYVVALWLGGIVINLLTFDPPRFYDIALRDAGLALAALALARLATGIRDNTRSA